MLNFQRNPTQGNVAKITNSEENSDEENIVTPSHFPRNSNNNISGHYSSQEKNVSSQDNFDSNKEKHDLSNEITSPDVDNSIIQSQHIQVTPINTKETIQAINDMAEEKELAANMPNIVEFNKGVTNTVEENHQSYDESNNITNILNDTAAHQIKENQSHINREFVKTNSTLNLLSVTNNQAFSTENKKLKKKNQTLEKEVNLLKSLILINNLNLNSFENNKANYKSDFFIAMCKQEKIDKIVNSGELYRNNTVYNNLTTMVKILKEDQIILKKELQEMQHSFIINLQTDIVKITERLQKESKLFI